VPAAGKPAKRLPVHVTGVLAVDAGPREVPHLLAPDGTRYLVRWPAGWRLQRRPLRLLAPDGAVVAVAGQRVLALLVPDPERATTAQVGPAVRAVAVRRADDAADPPPQDVPPPE
jgi:hypothetical protein